MRNQIVQTANLIELLGIGQLPEETQTRILDQAITLVQKRVMLRVMKILSARDRSYFSSLLNDPQKAEEAGTFLREHVPALADVTQEEINSVKAELKKIVGAVPA